VSTTRPNERVRELKEPDLLCDKRAAILRIYPQKQSSEFLARAGLVNARGGREQTSKGINKSFLSAGTRTAHDYAVLCTKTLTSIFRAKLTLETLIVALLLLQDDRSSSVPSHGATWDGLIRRAARAFMVMQILDAGFWS
jgi:hypothetical protein